MEISAMASMISLPWEGCLAQLYHFSYLKSQYNTVIVFDPSESDINKSLFPYEDWATNASGDCKEGLHYNARAPR